MSVIVKINSEGVIKAILLDIPAKKLSLEFASPKNQSSDKVKSISVQSHKHKNNPLLGQFCNYEHDDTLFDDLFDANDLPEPVVSEPVVSEPEPKIHDNVKYIESYLHVSLSSIKLRFESDDDSRCISLDLPSAENIRTEIPELLPLIGKHITRLVPSIDLKRDMCQPTDAAVPVSELRVSPDFFPSLMQKRRCQIRVV